MTLRWPALVCVALIALAGAVGAWMGYPFDRVWGWFAVVLALAMFFERFLVHRLRLRLRVEELERCYLGQRCRWTLRLMNPNSVAVSVRLKPVPPMAFTGEVTDCHRRLPTGDVLPLTVEQRAVRLGEHAWGAQPVELTGPFGLARWIRWLIPEPESAAGSEDSPGKPAPALISRVEPRLLDAARERVAMEQAGTRAVALRTMGGSEFRSLRQYAPGDPSSSIYWKALAKTSRLMVRETETDQQLSLLFMIDCGASSALQMGALDTLSHAVNLASRMGEYANASGDQFGLVAFAQDTLFQLAPGRGAVHQQKLRTALGQLEGADSESNPLAAMVTARKLLGQRSLVLLVTNLDDPEATGQLLQATALLRPQHLPMIVSIEDAAVRALAEQREVGETELYAALAAREYRRTNAETVARLERMGAVVVQAQPERLEKAVFARYRSVRGQRKV